MIQDELTIKLLFKLKEQYPDINILNTKEIIETILYDYNIQPQSKELALNSNLFNYVKLFLISKELVGYSSLTLYNYKLHLSDFARNVNKNIADITSDDVKMYLYYISKENNIKISTLSNITYIFRSFFKWSYVQEYIPRNIMDKIDNIKCEKNRRTALNGEQLEWIRIGCDTPRRNALFQLLLSTGLRISEVSKLNYGKINWSEKSIIVIGKGKKERVVYFSSACKVHLWNYLKDRENISLDSPIFINSKKPYNRLSVRSLEKEVNKIKENVHEHIEDAKVCPHIFRNSYASDMLSKGTDITTIQRLLGHNNLNTTNGYLTINDDKIKSDYLRCYN